jgi:hypothetical protein
VWTHDLLAQLLTGPDSPFEELPSGASFRVSIRRTTRVGDRAGVPVEDLGVVPDEIHQLTRRDLLEDNKDLFERAGGLLAGTRAYALKVDSQPENGGLRVKATARNLSRLDVTVNTRPVLTLDVTDGENSFEVAAVDAGDTVELRGFDGETLAACRRIEV